MDFRDCASVGQVSGVQSEVWLEKTGGFNQTEAFGRYPVMPEEAIFIIGRLVVVRWKLD